MHWNLGGCAACGGDLFLDEEDSSFVCLLCGRTYPQEGAQIVPLFLAKERNGPRNAPRMRLRPASPRLPRSA